MDYFVYIGSLVAIALDLIAFVFIGLAWWELRETDRIWKEWENDPLYHHLHDRSE